MNIKRWTKDGREKRAIALARFIISTGATVREISNYPIVETKSGEVRIIPINLKKTKRDKSSIFQELRKKYYNPSITTLSKTCIHSDVTDRLFKIDKDLFYEVQTVFRENDDYYSLFCENIMKKDL